MYQVRSTPKDIRRAEGFNSPEVQPEFSRLYQPASVLALQDNIKTVKQCAALHDVCQCLSVAQRKDSRGKDLRILFLTIIRWSALDHRILETTASIKQIKWCAAMPWESCQPCMGCAVSREQGFNTRVSIWLCIDTSMPTVIDVSNWVIRTLEISEK